MAVETKKPWDKDEKLEAFRLLCECYCVTVGERLPLYFYKPDEVVKTKK